MQDHFIASIIGLLSTLTSRCGFCHLPWKTVSQYGLIISSWSTAEAMSNKTAT